MSIVAAGQVKDVPQVDTSNPYADIILPPPAMRETIDKTAEFISKHGIDFERRMMMEANAAERFGFLFAGHGFRSYYERKLEEFRTGKIAVARPTIPEAVKMVKAKEEQQKLMLTNGTADNTSVEFDDVLKEHEYQEKTLLGFKKREFTCSRPVLTPMEEDILKLVAQYTACNGHSFTAGLSQRERGNPLFEFLRSGHAHHAYFKALVRGYSRILQAQRGELNHLVENLKMLASSAPLDHGDSPTDAVSEEQRLRHIAARLWYQEKIILRRQDRKRREEEEAAAEAAAAKSIAWERFILVECITFTQEDEHLPLAQPEWEKKTHPIVPEAEEPVLEQSAPEPLPETDAVADVKKSAPTAESVSVKTITVDGEDQKIVVKTDYVRKPKRATAGGVKSFKCPITGQIIPAENMSAHLKVLLLDKQWKKQRDELLARAVADSAYAPNNDIETNIADFVLRRPDLFGSVEDEIKEAVSRPEASVQKRSRLT